MSEAILDPRYWNRRLREAQRGHLFHAVFKCDPERWEQIERKHRRILAQTIRHDPGNSEKVLDVGCGYGRLLTLMPDGWTGAYIGVDLSPDLIALAKELHPDKHFVAGDIRNWGRSWGLHDTIKMDWAVIVSVRPMVLRHCGAEVWAAMEREVRRVAKRLLYLEYDENDEGSVE